MKLVKLQELHHQHRLSSVTTKPVFGDSNQVQYKLGCTVTEDGQRFEILDLASREIILSM